MAEVVEARRVRRFKGGVEVGGMQTLEHQANLGGFFPGGFSEPNLLEDGKQWLLLCDKRRKRLLELESLEVQYHMFGSYTYV